MQDVMWFFHELRDTWQVFWYNDQNYVLVIAGCALVLAGWFSLRRT
jgi:hypothetical protein